MVHQYRNNGYNIVLDVNSGAVHVVDDLAYEMISLYKQCKREELLGMMKEKYPKGEVDETLSEIEELISRDELFGEDEYRELPAQLKSRPTVVKALCLHVSHDCNLSCRYCFAGEGEYSGERELMSLKVGKAALDFLIAHSGARKNLEVDFFGGEPLMNWQLVKDLVAYGRELEKSHDKRFRFTLTTNGVLIDNEVIDFANREMSNVVLSIDGRREIHDHMRPFKSGSGSYELILPKLLAFAQSRGQKDYYVRGTYTHCNTDFSKDVIHLADRGFKQISVEPVVAEDSEEYAIRREDLPVLFAEYDALAAEILKRKNRDDAFHFFHFMIDLEGGPCAAKRLAGCGSGTEYLAVTPHGDLYPCHQFVGNTEFLMGNVWDGVYNTKLEDKFKESNVYEKEQCMECFARFYCSGGCAANSYHFCGDILGTYDIGCELQRKRVECAIMIKAAEECMSA